MQILVWLLIAYGITNILVKGEIALPLRAHIRRKSMRSKFYNFIDEMLMCMMCTSVWVGFFLGIFAWSPCEKLYNITPVLSWIFDGGLSTAGVWIMVLIIARLQKPDSE